MSTIYEPEYRILVECLKDYRLKSKMTQQELSHYLGCSQAYVSKYEQCQKRLDMVEVRRICLSLGISLLDLVAEFEERLLLGGI